MHRSLFNSLIISLFMFTLASCGGGGSAGIGGTGITSGGTITGFGSIFVNGVKYDTSGSTITIDDNIVDESALKLGMFVLVRGTLDTNNTTGTANSVSINIELKGPVTYQSYKYFFKTRTLLGLLTLIERARQNSDYSGIIINTSGLAAPREFLWEIREKLKQFKESSKKN